jgi:hypothetical protein
MEALSRVPRASSVDASECVSALLALCPLAAGSELDAEIVTKSLINLCTGVELSTLREMVNPKTGLPGTLKFPLKVADVNEFLEKREEFMRRRIQYHAEEIEQLEKRDEEVSPEERNRRADALKEFAKQMRCAATGDDGIDWRTKPMMTKEEMQRSVLEGRQAHDPKSLLEALRNLEAMRQPEREEEAA